MSIKYTSSIRNMLGEGCIWDKRSQSYYWVDILDKKVFKLDLQDNLTKYNLPDRIAFIFPRLKGGFILGFSKGLFSTTDFINFNLLAEVELDLTQTRLNDAAVAPDGSLIFGTMDEQEQKTVGAIYVFNQNGLEKIIPNIAISNGIAVDENHLFYTDTIDGIIYKCNYKDNVANIIDKEIFAKADIAQGKPDGSCLDSLGGYWNARVWGNCVIRISPEKELSQVFTLPIQTPTCVCFGGESEMDLFITSLSLKHTEADLRKFPLAGSAMILATDYKASATYECNF